MMTEVTIATHAAQSQLSPRYEALAQGEVPTAGQIVHLTGAASPQFTRESILLQVTDVEPSSVDASRGRRLDRASWLYLTGWELDRNRRHRLARTVLVRAAGLRVRH